MAEDGQHLGGLSSGLAVVLNVEDRKVSSQRNRLISYCDDFGDQSLERTLEHIFDLPCKSINPLTCPVDTSLIRSIIKGEFFKHHVWLQSDVRYEDGVSIVGNGFGQPVVKIDESSICGDIRDQKPPLLVESYAVFSSARANACVWKGKWMYEVTLETSGIQQLGWATLSCPFTDHTGVGDADDSYAYDGKRASKWNRDAVPYGQEWVIGDVIGCCIDFDSDEISFYRNGAPLGVAFDGIRKMVPGLGYYPAISLSQGERCEINFGAHPFRYPIQGFLPIQAPPSLNPIATQLFHCFVKLMELQRMDNCNCVEKLGRLKRFVPHENFFRPVSRAIFEELFSVLDREAESAEFIGKGPLLYFMMQVFGESPHDYRSLDRVLDIFLEFPGSKLLFGHVINSLSFHCKTASLVLSECPFSGSYPYLALACHILRREDLMVLWWSSSEFESLFEGFLSLRSPNKEDLQHMMPSVWWPGSCEENSYESSMLLTTRVLSEAVNKIEEKHRDLCCLVMQFIPPKAPHHLPGSVFRTFLQNLLLKNRGADRNIPLPGASSNSVIVSLFTVILHLLSEGFPTGGMCQWMRSSRTNSGADVGLLHRGGQQSFPISLFFKDDPYRMDIPRLGGLFCHLTKYHPVNLNQEPEVIRWEEGCMDDEETRVTHCSVQKPCCCSDYDVDFSRNDKVSYRFTGKGTQGHSSSIPERSAAAECSDVNLNKIADKPSSSDQSEVEYGFTQVHQIRIVPVERKLSAEALQEEELLDAMVLLYHLGLAPNFKTASHFMAHQPHAISLLEETDKKIRERKTGEQLRRLKESRCLHREEAIDCVRQCTWYRISLFSRWKQRGMYATCMWIVQFILVLSKMDLIFSYVPEFYLEALVDCFHVLRKSDPAFVPAGIFIKQGLSSFVTFVVTHFNDPRISSAELRDLLLQSISVLVQYKEFLAAFEGNKYATQSMPRALLSAFDNRSWIPVTNILLRLCKGSCFGSSKYGESSLSSFTFQKLLRDACIEDEELFSAFLNRLFNTLSWAMTEFSVSIGEMQEKCMMEFQQRKCSVIFDLSCNLARLLEFCTGDLPQAFLSGADTNLRRLIELVVFILNHLTSVADLEFFDLTLRRPGQFPEKVNRSMILAPLAGIILNLLGASVKTDCREQNDIVGVFASMDCPDTVLNGFQYLLGFNWTGSFRGEVQLAKLRQLQEFSNLFICRLESLSAKGSGYDGENEDDDGTCCICYAFQADAKFSPCSHVSCLGCISRHLLNCQRCFFCNSAVNEVVQNDLTASLPKRLH